MNRKGEEDEEEEEEGADTDVLPIPMFYRYG